MTDISVEKNPPEGRLKDLGVFNWPIWTKEVSRFPWTYDSRETCYFLAGEVIITPQSGESLTVGQGDLVTFPAGMSCTWDIKKPVRKHFTFDL
jgi:uncharacterized cupin superfamily protein